MKDNVPKLTAEARVSGPWLVLRYSLENTTDEDLLVFNGLYNLRDGKAVVEPNRVYTLITDDRLILAKAVLDIPFGVQVEVPDTPYATQLKAGSVLKEEIKVPVSLDYDNPHDLVTNTRDIACSSLVFRLGYAPIRTVQGQYQKIEKAKKEYFRLKYAIALKSQRVLESELGEFKISVHMKP